MTGHVVRACEDARCELRDLTTDKLAALDPRLTAMPDQVAAWRDTGVCVISGFHSPLEQQCLDILLRGKQPIVWVLARGIVTLRLPKPKRTALDDGRLTMVSPFPAGESRTNADLARQRNRVVAALAAEMVFAHISSGRSLERLAGEVAQWGMQPTVLQP